MIIGFLGLIIKAFDNQTEIFRELGLIIKLFRGLGLIISSVYEETQETNIVARGSSLKAISTIKQIIY